MISDAGTVMILNTRRLFVNLLRPLGIDTVCDVGSMNGAEALAFRAALPEATVIAFEANPENIRLMRADTLLRDRNIEVVPLAATNYDGNAEFFVVKADYSTVNDRRGMSSLFKRPGESHFLTTIPVRTTRLDTFLADRLHSHPRLALWIDVEGKAYEVIDGAAGLVDTIQLLHVELESFPCIAPDQKLYNEVLALLRSFGFVELATDLPPALRQFNSLFVRRNVSQLMRLEITRNLAIARARHLLGTGMSTIARVKARPTRRPNSA